MGKKSALCCTLTVITTERSHKCTVVLRLRSRNFSRTYGCSKRNFLYAKHWWVELAGTTACVHVWLSAPWLWQCLLTLNVCQLVHIRIEMFIIHSSTVEPTQHHMHTVNRSTVGWGKQPGSEVPGGEFRGNQGENTATLTPLRRYLALNQNISMTLCMASIYRS